MARRRRTIIGNQPVWVDSYLEERVLTWLESSGFSGRWRRPEAGLNAGRWNYTPDVELYIQHGGKPHLAIVEIKPVLYDKQYGFTPYIFKRMRKAARVYYADVLLLYVDATKTWYRIDTNSGGVTLFGAPVPAVKTISSAYAPLTIGARSVWSHRYRQRLDSYMLRMAGRAIADGLEAIIRALTSSSKTNSKRNSRRRSH